MTAAIQDILTPRYGAEDQAIPELLEPGVDAATTIYGGTMVMVKSNGYAAPAAPGTAGSLGMVIGRAERQVVNTTAAGYGSAGALRVQVDRGAFWFNLNADSTVTIANFGQNVYASDDNTVSLSDGGGTRPLAGYLLSIPTTPGIPGLQGGTASTKVAVQLGFPSPWSASATPSLSSVGKARAVVTTLQAYGGSGTNVLTQTTASAGLSAADGVTLAVGDVVLIQGGTANLTAAKDSGPWQVTALGSASVKWVLTRPDWFSTGAVVPLGQVIEIGGEGAMWLGTSWKSFAPSGSAVVGTNDPEFYVGRVSQTITLAASTFGICAASTQATNVGIYSATTTGIDCSSSVGGTPIAGTIGYGPVAAATPGYIGTSVLTIDALASGMAKNGTTDTSHVIVTITNW